MSDEPDPARKIIPIEDLRREARARRERDPFAGDPDAGDPDADPASFAEPDEADFAPEARPEPPAPGLWDRVGDVHPGFTYGLVLAILIGFAAQLVTATAPAGSIVAGGSLAGPFVTAGAALRGPFLAGEWWRAFAPIFLHANLLHLGSNLLALAIVGGVVERAFGHARFLVLFTVAALAGSLATFEHQRLVEVAGGFGTLGSIGASGAVYGVGAAVVAAAIRLRGLLSPWRARALIGATLPLLLSSLAGGFARPGTDNAAHLGGAVAGAVLGFVLPLHGELQRGKEPGPARALWAAAGLVGLSALVASGILAFQHGMAAGR